jgi:hypothetical protein
MIALIAAFQYLEQVTERFFEARMQRVAIRIDARSRRRVSGRL